MVFKIKKLIRSILSLSLKLINTIYYYFYPDQTKIVVKGFFSKYFGYISRNNLGDELNFYILKSISNRKVFSQNNLLKSVSNILFIGSIIEAYTDSNSIIWGAGAISGKKELITKPSKVYSVRGPLTRKYLLINKIKCPEIYGDPALLLPLIYSPPQKRKKYKYGIIPHYIDLTSKNVKILTDILSDNYTVIKFKEYSNWQKTIDQINECEYIISSSLHGIIISDAYGIPNIWVEFSKKVDGNGFKFRDYFRSVKRNVDNPIEINMNIKTDDILSKLINRNERPLINMLPFLKNAPIEIPSSFIKKAEEFYCKANKDK